MSKKPHSFSRRDFLKGLSIGAVTVASSSVLASCAPKVAETPVAADATAAPAPESSEGPWYGTEPEIAASDIAETIDTDVLICGAGTGGMMAAIVSAKQGAKTLVIEKNPTVGTFRTYVGAVDTKAQLAAGDKAKISKTEIVQEIARYGSNHVDQKLIRLWADESGETVDFLADELAEFGITHVAEYDTGSGYHGIYKAFPTHTKFLVPAEVGGRQGHSGGGHEPLLVKKAEGYGAEFKFNTPLIKLVKDGNKVTGAIAKNADGKYIQINAAKGVLLCTGGYADDEDLYNKLNPAAAAVTVFGLSQPGTTADGIKAGIWAGGEKNRFPAAMLFDRGTTMPGGKSGVPFRKGGLQEVFHVGSQPFLRVNMDGKRFCNESAPYDFVLYPLQNEKNGVYCEIWDANYWQNIESFHTIGCSRLVPSTSEPATQEGVTKEGTDAVIAGFVQAGIIQQADTLEELAAKLMLPPDAFKASVEHYNEMAKAGTDEDFGKPASDLFALETAPFYGVTAAAWLLTTMDGLHINTDMQVLDAAGAPIEGLYAAGDTAGGFFAHNYPELCVGVACGKTITFARHAVLKMTGSI